jgi:hypothetical protein
VTKSCFVEVFQDVPVLQELSLQRCHLQDAVPLSVLARVVPQLKTLNLRGNLLLHVPDGALDALSSLRVLDMGQNLMRAVSEGAFNHLVRQRLESVSFLGNPLTCSCDVLWLKLWMHASPATFSTDPRVGNIHQCHDEDNYISVAVTSLLLPCQACLFSQSASLNIIVNVTLATCVLVSVILLYRFRWHMRLVLHEALRSEGQARRLQRLQNNHFDYDVFVSYASENLPWVRRHLMPQLEEGLGLRLCIHERDFITGKNIVDNISDCVESSKKVMMLFSRHFKRSQWCQFELAYCLTHVMDYDDVLIIVCLDDITSYELPSTIMAVLKTTTYIQWSREPGAVRSFWGRLQLSLKEILRLVELHV